MTMVEPGFLTIGWVVVALAVASIGYTIHAIAATNRFARMSLPAVAPSEPVTLLKPVHGAEPRLRENLSSFFDQDWHGHVQMVVGANRSDDPALPIARAVGGDIAICVDAPTIGANAKIANVANLIAAARHDLLILSDSDIAVSPDYIGRVAAALAMPGVGAVTCLYHGRGDTGGWSRFAAAAVSWQFIPMVVMSLALKVDHPCMGSTIALRRTTLEAIGGFAAFKDVLADDYAIGAAVRKLGLAVEPVPAFLVAHGGSEDTLSAVWRHELRWSRTLRAVSGWGHIGSILTHPLPLALLTLPFHLIVGSAIMVSAIATRLLLARSVDRLAAHRPASLWLLPARDILSFAVFLASLFVRSVDWRGASLRMAPRGTIIAGPENAP
ncbi:bacteriohopanetetrol glucosamine biosynthesis glycosyltransferase HpnI [Sphingomonas bacterium]|uniref:bacteriohopanetetrol glucosamine biosynthesis glycosyltransferase HpnI n=1 Tax=Sphingomonas bacterium TaxID=1895847 RepID=UPI0015761F83|nr:bacteriohopanetetrol glucosamine biosynthesis glycosyltransferase HpnI [Sphingomonas bacterium]